MCQFYPDNFPFPFVSRENRILQSRACNFIHGISQCSFAGAWPIMERNFPRPKKRIFQAAYLTINSLSKRVESALSRYFCIAQRQFSGPADTMCIRCEKGQNKDKYLLLGLRGGEQHHIRLSLIHI